MENKDQNPIRTQRKQGVLFMSYTYLEGKIGIFGVVLHHGCRRGENILQVVAVELPARDGIYKEDLGLLVPIGIARLPVRLPRW